VHAHQVATDGPAAPVPAPRRLLVRGLPGFGTGDGLAGCHDRCLAGGAAAGTGAA